MIIHFHPQNCREFYGNTPFTKDIKGHDEYCRWCAEARAIIRCHTCSNVFCKARISSNIQLSLPYRFYVLLQGCLKRCLGHVPFAEVTGSKCAWNCLICNDLPLWAPRALARTVMSAIKYSSVQIVPLPAYFLFFAALAVGLALKIQTILPFGCQT